MSEGTIFLCIHKRISPGRTIKKFNEEITWMKRGKMLHRLEPLENEVLTRSVEMLLNRNNGTLVIDNKLISSRDGDVEQKTVSEQKSGKEGPFSDCIACSFTRFFLE